jgi:hypothetical protein
LSIIRSLQERKKLIEAIRTMLDSSFYLEMKLTERLKLIKVLIAS